MSDGWQRPEEAPTDDPPRPDGSATSAPLGDRSGAADQPPGPSPTGHPAGSSGDGEVSSLWAEARLAGDPGAEEMEEMAAEAEEFARAAEQDPELQVDADPAAAAVEIDLDLAQTAAERDEYLDALRRLQADFENYKKRMLRQQTETLERAGEDLVSKLLPALDTIDLARLHGAGDAVEQVAGTLVDILVKEGLERIDPQGKPFDPNEHEAVVHEGGEGGPTVVEVLRAGYRWRGRLLRPALVKVQG